MLGVEPGEFVGARRREITMPRMGESQGRRLIYRAQKRALAFAALAIPHGRLGLNGSLGSGDQRPVAGAAAEIPSKTVVDGLPIRRRPLQAHRVERHHEARRAEAALRSMRVDDGLLAGMQFARRALKALDRDDRLAVQHRQKLDAGVHRPVAHCIAVELADRNRAGAAIALGAAFFRPGEALPVTQVIEQRHGRRQAGNGLAFAVQNECQLLAHPWSVIGRFRRRPGSLETRSRRSIRGCK